MISLFFKMHFCYSEESIFRRNDLGSFLEIFFLSALFFFFLRKSFLFYSYFIHSCWILIIIFIVSLFSSWIAMENFISKCKDGNKRWNETLLLDGSVLGIYFSYPFLKLSLILLILYLHCDCALITFFFFVFILE